MEIVRSAKLKVDFSNVDVGECFEMDGIVLIRTDYEQDAVALESGEVYSGLCGEEVTLIKAKLVIGD